MKTLKTVATALSAAFMLTVMSMPALAQQQETPENAELARFFYRGGAHEGVSKVADNTPYQTTSRTYINVPGASASWFVPANDSDLLNVSFSAECRLINNPNPPAGVPNWVEIRVMLSRVPALAGFPRPMQPNDGVSRMALCSANLWAMHAAQFAERVSGGSTGATYTATVQYRINAAAGLALTAWVDDYMLELHAYN